MKTSVNTGKAPVKGELLSNIRYGSFVRVLSGQFAGLLCLWTRSGELVPLCDTWNTSFDEARLFSSFDVRVEVLSPGEFFTITVNKE